LLLTATFSWRPSQCTCLSFLVAAQNSFLVAAQNSFLVAAQIKK
jgi:hypothetical protein